MRLAHSLVSEFPAGPAAVEAPAPVERRARLDADEFRREYRDRRRPVVLADAAAAWPIHGRGTPDYFRARYGTQRVRLLGEPCTLAALLDRLEASTPERPAPYPCKFEIATQLRALLPEVTPRFAASLPDRQGSALLPQRLFAGVNNLEIFFGGPGGRFPYLHYDVMHLHAWITQLHGEKEFILYPPEQGHLLYADPATPWQSRVQNHHAPDLERWPLLRKARPQRVVIGPGDTLFLPCGWWHTARSLGVTISVAFDQLGPDNWSDFAADVADERRRAGRGGRALLLASYLRALGPLLGIAERLGANRPRRWGAR